MRTQEPVPAHGPKYSAARGLTELLAPSVIVVVLPPAVAWHATRALAPAVLWGLIVALTSSVLPMAVIIWGSRTGRWEGHHVRNREGRLIPFLTLITLSLSGLLILVIAGAPWPVIALDISMIVCLLVTGTVTIFWKISMHSAVAAGSVIVLVLTYGARWALLSVLVVAIAWSRVVVRDHTPAQVIVGSVTGALFGGGLFALLLAGFGAW